jgi:hypothetical protein
MEPSLEKHSRLVHGVNDRMSAAHDGSASTLVAFQCECGDVYCWETVSLSRADYGAFRAANNGTPLLAPHHLRHGHSQRVSPIVS